MRAKVSKRPRTIAAHKMYFAASVSAAKAIGSDKANSESGPVVESAATESTMEISKYGVQIYLGKKNGRPIALPIFTQWIR